MAYKVAVRNRSIHGWLAVTGCLVGLFAGLAPMADVLGWLSLWMATAAVAVIGARNADLRAPLLAGFFARGGAALVQAYAFPLPGSQLDAFNFERIGWVWASDGLSGAFDYFTSGAYLYSWIIAVIYAATDRSALMIQVLNVLFGTLIIRNVYFLALQIWHRVAARRAAWITALFPTLVLYSALTLREVAVAYPLTLGVLWFVRWRVTQRPHLALGAMLAFTVAIAFHVVVIGMIAAALLLVFLNWGTSLLKGRFAASARSLVGLLLAGVIATLVIRLGWGNFNYTALLSTELISFQQEVAAVERTAYLQGFVSEDPFDMLWQLPIRTVFFLFMPFPWMMTSVVDLIGVIDAFLYFWLFWHVVRSFKVIWRNLPARTALVLTASTIIIFALVVSNYGTAIRHRAKVVPLIAALAAVGMTSIREDSTQRSGSATTRTAA